MRTELEQLAAEFRKKNICPYPAHGSGIVEIIRSDFEANLANLLREVQRQTIEAACRVRCQYCASGIPAAESPFDDHYWHSDGRVRCDASDIRSLLSPSQEVKHG